MASKAQQFREHWAGELDGAAMYRALAERADGDQREIFLELAEAEERHAAHWAAKLVELGEPSPGPTTTAGGGGPGWWPGWPGGSGPGRCCRSSSGPSLLTPATTTACPTPPRPWPPTSGSTPGSWPG